MRLIQRNVIPILALLAVIGVGLTIFVVTSPFASGQETDGCDPGVGISIATNNASGQTVVVVNHGDDVYYSVKLFKEESLCDFGGGTLTITLPGSTADYPDGTVEIPISDTITLGNSFNSDRIQYSVDQDDGIQANAEDLAGVKLTVSAVYEGISYNTSGDELPLSAGAVSVIHIRPPSVEIDISPSVQDPNNPDTQSVLLGQTAYFDVVISNTGGFELSDISVASLENAGAGEVPVADCERAANAFGNLAVGSSPTVYQCSTTAVATFRLRAEVTASGTAMSAARAPVALQVTDDDATTVFVGTSAVGITIAAQQDPVRYQDDEAAREGSFTIVATTPTGTDLDNISVSATVTGPGEGESAAAGDCNRQFATVAADRASKPADLGTNGYSCSTKMYQGFNTIEATIEGTIPGSTTLLTATASTTVEAITPGLTITLSPEDHTILVDEAAAITVTVTNGASELTGVSVVDPDPNNEDGLELSGCTTGADDVAISLAAIGNLGANEQIVILCSTAGLTAETGYEAVAIGTARDNTTEPSGVATAIVRILSPSTDVGVSLLEGGSMVVQLVVQTVVVTETNDGDSDVTGVYVDLDAAGIGPNLTSQRLTRQSPEFVGSHGEGANDDDVLNPGETWEWRVVVVGVAGNVVLLSPDATSIDVTASGYGTDDLGGEVNPETDADEIETQTFPFSVN